MCKWSSKRITNPEEQNLRENLNDRTLPTYYLYILQEQWLTVQVLIFVLTSWRDVKFFVEFSRSSQNLWAREERLSELVLFLMEKRFLKFIFATKR